MRAVGEGRIERFTERSECQEGRGSWLVVGGAGGEQVGDEVAVAAQPIGRQRRPSAPFQGDEIQPVLPRADDGARFRALRGRLVPLLRVALEEDVVSVAVDGEPRPKGALGERVVVERDAGAALLPAAQLRRESNRLGPIEIDAPARHQVQLVAESGEHLSLFAEAPGGHLIAEGDDHVSVDSRDRRVSVDEGR